MCCLVYNMADKIKDSYSNEDTVHEVLSNHLETECNLDTNTQNESNRTPDASGDNSEDDHEKTPSVEDDFVDEAALKEVESTLSQEDLDKRKTEAASLKLKGNEQFKQGNNLDAIKIYTEALCLCPLSNTAERSVLYCNRAAAKLVLERKKSAIDDCTKAIELNDMYVRAYLRRAKLYEESDKLDESLEDFKKVLELDPSNSDARCAVIRLPPKIDERNEKLKTEMLGK